MSYFKWIKNYPKPILGICHGLQLIGVIYGANLIRDVQSEDGACTINIAENNHLFRGCGRILKVKQSHNDSITLPSGFLLLASSSKCRVEAIKHKEKFIYGAQFHVEENVEIIINFIRICNLHDKLDGLC